MRLDQQIEQLKQDMADKIPQDAMAVMQDASEALQRSGLVGQALKAGDTVADFDLPEVGGGRVRLADVLLAGPVVISFYRGAWCPYCNLEMQALQRELPEIKACGASLLAIAPELPEYAGEIRDKGNLTFPLLHDRNHALARQFGLVFSLPESLQAIYTNFGIELAASQGNDGFELPMPATYIVDQSGTIVHAFVDADYTKRMEPSEITDILKHMKRRN